MILACQQPEYNLFVYLYDFCVFTTGNIDLSIQVVTARVNKAISKMIWPNNAHQRGIHWDIFFEPLVDNGYKQIPSAFVIVVTVVQCSGGVFVEKPESYRLVNGKPEAIPFEIWKKRVTSDETGCTECDGRKAQGTKTNPNLHR